MPFPIFEEVFQHTGQNVLLSLLDQDSFCIPGIPAGSRAAGQGKRLPSGWSGFLGWLGYSGLWRCVLYLPGRCPQGGGQHGCVSGSCGQTTALSERIFFIPGKKGRLQIDFTRLTFGRGLLAEGYSQAVEQEVQNLSWMVCRAPQCQDAPSIPSGLQLNGLYRRGRSRSGSAGNMQNEEALRSSSRGEDTVDGSRF